MYRIGKCCFGKLYKLIRSVFFILNNSYVQAGLLVCNFLLHNIASAQLENLQHILNLRDNFHSNTIWQRQSMAALIFCWRLAESDVIFTPSAMYMDYIGDTIMQLMLFPLLHHWLLLSTWVRNVNVHCLVQSKWKIGERQRREIGHNEQTRKRWTNYWHMV
jgi:hypothetical protein